MKNLKKEKKRVRQKKAQYSSASQQHTSSKDVSTANVLLAVIPALSYHELMNVNTAIAWQRSPTQQRDKAVRTQPSVALHHKVNKRHLTVGEYNSSVVRRDHI